MTERGRRDIARHACTLQIGKSLAHWDGDALKIEIDEWTAPIPSRVRGEISVRAHALISDAYALDARAHHVWKPIAPSADIDVRFSEPHLTWRGRAYFDCNWGAEPPERAFARWDWSRAHLGAHDCVVHYDVTLADGAPRGTSLRFNAQGSATPINAPPPTTLGPTFWRLHRSPRGGDEPATLVRTLEDTPFYARSWLRAPIESVQTDIFHESLSLKRLSSPIVRAMLPFRMPRVARA